MPKKYISVTKDKQGSRCCSMCGRNAASVYGSDVYNRGGKFDVTKLGYHLPSE